MTEHPGPYLTITDSLPAITPALRYRLTLPTGSSITLEPAAGGLDQSIAASTLDYILSVFRTCNPAGPDGIPRDYAHCVPEILSQATLDHIDALEAVLNDCRNALLDADAPTLEDAGHWENLIDAATRVLGYDELIDQPA